MASFTSSGVVVGIVGATGAVGVEVIKCLEKLSFPVSRLRLFASARSAGKLIPTGYGDIAVEEFTVAAARECKFVFLAVSGDFALEHAKAISAGDDGAIVIDNSSAFRYMPDIPLVVPEINAHAIGTSKLIANPNCTTAIAAVALWPLHVKFGIKKLIVSTYQAASGAGAEGMEELLQGTRAKLNGEPVTNTVFAHPLPFNLIPHIDKFLENGYTKEEMKVTWETKKIFGLTDDDIKISCTAVRIPTMRAHSEAITIETVKPITPDAARSLLANTPGVRLVDDPASLRYPMPLTATESFDVEVGRIRESLVFAPNGLELFVSGDQLLRGAALNAVLIAQKIMNP
jgi:aspartate-semialdehyde dehydrogenase